MTWKEKLQEECPNLTCGLGGGFGCPHMHFKEATKPTYCDGGKACERCWSRTVPETKTEPKMTAADVQYLDNDINVARAIYRHAMNSVYGLPPASISKPSDCNKNCTNCKYLNRDADEEPCKSCNAIGRNPTNWVYRDNSDLYYDRNTDTWKPRFDPQDISTWYPQSMFVPGRRNGKTYDMQRLIYSMLATGDPVAVARKQYRDGLSAQVYAIDELHNVKNEERKDNMPTRSYSMFGNLTISPTLPEIEDVIFNPPATIVFWKDKTKTVVKANNEEYDPEKGLAMAMIKKLYGNKGNYCNKLKKWTDKYSGKYPAEKADETRANVSVAYDLLITIRDSKKMTKSQMVYEIEDAIGYLGEALED